MLQDSVLVHATGGSGNFFTDGDLLLKDKSLDLLLHVLIHSDAASALLRRTLIM